MKKLCIAVFLGLWLLFSFSCSSSSGTTDIGDLLKKGADKLGEDVVVVGMAETKTPLSSFGMFRLYDGQKSIWVSLPQSGSMPPQAARVRVTGVLGQKEFNVVGKVFYIEAIKVAME
jgi:hypothetical protein